VSPGSSTLPDVADTASGPRPERRKLGLGLWRSAAAAALLVVFAINVRRYWFLGDDCYISFRYARHLLDGNGLVWNIGEPVEGYTNFLWVLMMSAGMALGAGPELLSNVIGVLSGLGVLALVVTHSADRHGWRSPVIWIAPAALVVSRSFTAWCTGGLETQWFAFLVLCGVLSLIRERRRDDRWPWMSSLFLTLATLTRPDGGIFMLACGLCFLVDVIRRKRRLGSLLFWVLPYVAVVGGHLLWRHNYYGYWLPNTFYAKVGGIWLDQGFDYFRLFASDYQITWFLPLLILPVILRRSFENVVLTTTTLLYLVYVLVIGGDRFEFRFVVVVFPGMYLLISEGIALIADGWRSRPSLERPRAIAAASLAIVLVTLTALGSVRAGTERTRNNIASVQEIEAYADRRAEVGKVFRGFVDTGVLPSDLRFSTGGVGAIPFYTMWYILDVHGLNNTTIAHAPLEKRGVIGHERRASPEFIRDHEMEIHNMVRPLLSSRTDTPEFHRAVKTLKRRVERTNEAAQRAGKGSVYTSKCLMLDETNIILFSTTVTEERFRRRFGHISSCPGF